MQYTVNGGLPLLALPFFRVVYVDTDALGGLISFPRAVRYYQQTSSYVCDGIATMKQGL